MQLLLKIMKNVYSKQGVSIGRSLHKQTPRRGGNRRKMKQAQIKKKKIPSVIAVASGATSSEIPTKHNRPKQCQDRYRLKQTRPFWQTKKWNSYSVNLIQLCHRAYII